MRRSDPVRALLRARGAGQHVIDGGLKYLVERWRTTVAEVERGYTLTHDDYLNDMDARQLLHEALNVAPKRQRSKLNVEIASLDERFKAATVAVDRCIWGGDDKARGWSPNVNWWYYRLAKDARRRNS